MDYNNICPHCNANGDGSDIFGGPDPCFGIIPGISWACCGHGNRNEAYFVLRYETIQYMVRGIRAYHLLVFARDNGIETLYPSLKPKDVWKKFSIIKE